MSCRACLSLMPLTLLLCSCGASPGKRLAAKDALAALESLRNKTADGSSRVNGYADPDSIARRLDEATRAGDPTREADVRVSIDLGWCKRVVIGTYGLYVRALQRKENENYPPELSTETLSGQLLGSLESCRAMILKDIGEPAIP